MNSKKLLVSIAFLPCIFMISCDDSNHEPSPSAASQNKIALQSPDQNLASTSTVSGTLEGVNLGIAGDLDRKSVV